METLKPISQDSCQHTTWPTVTVRQIWLTKKEVGEHTPEYEEKTINQSRHEGALAESQGRTKW